jgi:hypothetical protein
MKSHPQTVAQAGIACATRVNYALFTSHIFGLLMLCTGFARPDLCAQSFTEHDLSDFVHAVNAQNALLMQGDTATFEVTLGDEDAPANHVMGMRLTLALSAVAQIPNNVVLSIDGSWCFDAANLYTQVSVVDIPLALNLVVRSADSSTTSGEGLVFSFQLIAAQDSVETSDMIAAINGVVIVENIDCKWAPLPQTPTATAHTARSISDARPTPTKVQHCYPNPTQGPTQLPLRMEAGLQVTLVAADGHVYELHVHPLHEGMGVDMSAFPAGAYTLMVWLAGKCLYKDRILKI